MWRQCSRKILACCSFIWYDFVDSIKHIAIIPDGNNRWAKKNLLNPIQGYAKGAETVKQIAIHANEIGLEYLTVYLLSLENLTRRSKPWLDSFFNFCRGTLKRYIDNKEFECIKIKTIGCIELLPEDIISMIETLTNATKDNDGLVLTLAIAYTGKDEIVRAVNKIVSEKINSTDKVEAKNIAIDVEGFQNYLDTKGIPDPDLLIRTSGEVRLSGYLLWQVAYSEFLFVPELWPDFTPDRFDWAIEEFQKRTRNFGKER